MAKRSVVEVYEEVSEVVRASPNAKIHAVVQSVSPMKKSKTCSYFDGEVTDGKSTMRVYGFDCGVRRKLVEFGESRNAVVMSNCEVKRSRKGEELEILVTKHTEVEKSEKVFDVESKFGKAGEKVITLKELHDLLPFQRVTVEVKAVRVEEPTEVSGGKKKQDVLVGDSTGTARFTVWEGEIGTVDEDVSYRLSGMMVREFRGKKFLSTSKENSKIEKISDIGDVEEEVSEEESDQGCTTKIKDARVIGVMYLEKYNGCLKCSAKVVPDKDDVELGCCSKCSMMQCVDVSTQELSAQLVIKSANGNVTLRAFSKTVQDIADKPVNEVTMVVLLKAKPFTLVHHQGIIQSISRMA